VTLEPFSIATRERLLATRVASLREYNAILDCIADCVPGSDEEVAAATGGELALEAATRAETEYFRGLPRLPMSCCPFDAKPLYRTFDPHGFDGLWWRSDASPAEPPSCPHFCLLRGAVSLNGNEPHGGDFVARIGPEAPYVIPRILEKSGMIAVLSKLEMTPGYTAYLIAYFAERRPPVQDLAAHWPRPIFLYNQGAVLHRWRFDRELCDFDLASWLKRGKIRWCDGTSNNERLSDDPPDRCPYVNLPGRREFLEIVDDQVRVAGPLAGPGYPRD
jgi:hypothetical protein